MRSILCAAFVGLAACAPVTVSTTRPVPPWDDPSAAATIEEDERKLWEQAKEERAKLAAQDVFVSDDALIAYLKEVLATLLVQPLPAQLPPLQAYVMRSPARIGAMFPDGAILITTGMLAALQNEAQLAAVLGHEFGHFVARHRLVQYRFAESSRSTVERMELSRANEAFSDRYALDAMRRAGYDPREIVRMLESVGPDEEGPQQSALQSSAFRSHPFTRERIEELNVAIGVAPSGKMRVGTEEYGEAIAGVLPIAAEVELKAGQLDRARATIARLRALRPDSGRAYYLDGELARLTEREGRRSTAARRAYERAVELAPDDPEAVRTLAFLYEADGDLARARPLFETYLRLAPEASDRKLIERSLGRTSP